MNHKLILIKISGIPTLNHHSFYNIRNLKSILLNQNTFMIGSIEIFDGYYSNDFTFYTDVEENSEFYNYLLTIGNVKPKSEFPSN